jgi:mannitol/fructose-specific phosphotransferase system IIA component (Ntr-type)
MILAPHQERSNEYLPLLGKIVELTRDAGIRKKLLKAKDIDGIAEAITDKAKSK